MKLENGLSYLMQDILEAFDVLKVEATAIGADTISTIKSAPKLVENILRSIGGNDLSFLPSPFGLYGTMIRIVNNEHNIYIIVDVMYIMDRGRLSFVPSMFAYRNSDGLYIKSRNYNELLNLSMAESIDSLEVV